MSSVLPLEIIAQIIDIVGENNDTNLLKEIALVSYSFHQMCSKHLFATVELHDAVRLTRQPVASSKRGFVKLLKSRPGIVKYIRNLVYEVSQNEEDDDDGDLLSPILPNYLRTISCLNCLAIVGSKLDWNTLNSSLTSALLYLMHLPTINHIDLSFIQNFPLSSLTSVNLLRLDIYFLCRSNPRDDSKDTSEFVVDSELMPKLREFHTSDSAVLTRKLLHAKRQDGQPAFNFMGLREVSMNFEHFEDGRNIGYLLQNARLLEKLHLSVDLGWSLVNILSPSTCTLSLKVLDFTVPLFDESISFPLGGICEVLEAMAGHNVLEALSFEVNVDGHETENFVGSIIQNVEKVLLKPGWSALRQVSFKISIACCLSSRNAELSETLQSLPDKYLSHLSKLESVAFSFSAFVVKCGL